MAARGAEPSRGASALIIETGSARAMEALGRRLAPCLGAGIVVHLSGPLGSGKTTLVRGMLRGLGVSGAVKSPTYTLVEPYETGAGAVYHFDLYRVQRPEELEQIGVRDYVDGRAVCLVEWPERGAGLIAPPDVSITIGHMETGRRLQFVAHTGRGEGLFACLQ